MRPVISRRKIKNILKSTARTFRHILSVLAFLPSKDTTFSPAYLPTLSPIRFLRALPLCAVGLAALTVSCSSIDRPLNSLVYTQYQLMTADGRIDTLTDTLTISTSRMTDGSDSVLINKNVKTTGFSLPISYAQPQDVFYFETIDTVTKTTTLDVVTVTKEDHPHFESVDCSPSYFHTITGVTTTHNAIDSIVIKNPDVNYDTSKKHFYIYFKHRD